jgi:hypothetical protein
MKRLDIETVKQEFISRGYEPLFDEYKNDKQKLAYRCPKHPDEKLEISLNSLRAGHGCWKCGRKRSADKQRVSIGTARQDFIDRGYEPLFDEYKNNKQKLAYRCPKHPNEKLEISLDELKHGHGCPYCGGNAKITLEEARQDFIDRGYEPLFDEYENDKQKLAYRCPKHPDEKLEISLNSLRAGHGCWKCGNESKMEQETSEYLTTHNYRFRAQYNLSGTKMRFDFMLLDNNDNPKIAIELNGRQHYEPVRFGGISLKRAKQNFISQQKRDQLKRDWCAKEGIKLIEIPYYDFDLDKYFSLLNNSYCISE